jgi:FdhD protein
VAAQGVSHRTLTISEDITWMVPEEVPVAMVYNGTSHAVMMATPADLQDFAIGFTLAEGLLPDASAIEEVEVIASGRGLMAALSVTPAALDGLKAPIRAMAGRSGCGLCGVESLDAAVRSLPALATPLRHRPTSQQPGPEQIARALRALPDHQPMNAQNRSVHAAAFCRQDGSIVLAREDVGRHNALDKLIGACVRRSIALDQGFVVMTSRCSFELVQKAVTVGIPLLATLSAPTSLALELAAEAGLVLAARSRGGGVVLFSAPTDQEPRGGR